MKRKYNRYEVASNHEGEEETFYDYRLALSFFQSIRKYGKGTRCTLWGINEMGEYNCILAYSL